MKFLVKPSTLKGELTIPGSKSHTIRALVCALLAEGRSVVENPLDSSDTRSCLEMVRRFGAVVEEDRSSWIVSGKGRVDVPDNVVDIGNSGTSLYFGMGVASIADGFTVFTGDHQIRNRPAGPLLDALRELGATAYSTRGNGKPPAVIGGVLKGGRTSVEAHTSQYLSSLLLTAPMAQKTSTINVPVLNEAPYVDMTLRWMDMLGIQYENKDYKVFTVPGNQSYRSFTTSIPADFSSATFFMCAAAVTGSEIVLRGLDFSDTQGDKQVVDILKVMGVEVTRGENLVNLKGKELRGGTFDLNAIPDALPALSVTACFAEGETRLVNVAQARLKETDRIRVMHDELKKLGAEVEEIPDGLIVRKSRLKGTRLHGHGDHRVVMSLAVAGLGAEGKTEIDTAESVSVTFPDYCMMMKSIGADIHIEEENQ